MGTEEDKTTTDDTPVEPLEKENAYFGGSSLMDALKADLEEIAEQVDVYLPVTGYSTTGLSIRYGMPESSKLLDGIVRKVLQQTKDKYDRGLFITMDTMIFLCQGLYVKHPDDPDIWVELDPDDQGTPITLSDGRLAINFGWEGVDSARATVRKLFGGKSHDIAIFNHGEKLNRWLQDTKADITTELWQLGELG